jgi:monoterpene epsilon-lactone hydrolase
VAHGEERLAPLDPPLDPPLEHERRRLAEIRSELEEVSAELRPAVDRVLAGEFPSDALVQALRFQDPVPPGPPVPLEPLASGGGAAWLGGPSSERAMLYCHAGGGVSGSVNGNRERAEELAAVCRLPVYAVEYRLAPEHPFPSDIEDVVCAYRTLRDSGFSPESIVFGGHSHGAGLALSAMVRVRELGEPLPAAAFLACGVYDRSVVVRDGFLEREVDWQLDDPILSHAPFLRWLVYTYLGAADPADPLASPLQADLHGLPPLLIQVGEMEVLRGQGQRLASSIRQAGGEATLEVFPRMFHNFHAYPLAAAGLATRRAASFLRDRLR